MKRTIHCCFLWCLGENGGPEQRRKTPCNGTQQWHHVHSPKVGRPPLPPHFTPQRHPAMAPRPLPQPPQTTAHYNGTLQSHQAIAPPQRCLPSPRHSTLQWHPTRSSLPPKPQHTAIAPYDAAQQWHHIHCIPTIAHYNGNHKSWSSPSPPTIAHYNGTLQWHHGRSPTTLPSTIAHYNGTPQLHP